MQDFEKLGVFYLGKRVARGSVSEELLLYESSDLTTHAVIVGMTGSGKTGLGIALIEEAALDHIPVIAIDPKGDLGNLLLKFPELRPEDFAPWVGPQSDPAEVASAWRRGLAEWGQSPERIARLAGAAEALIWTPGSNAGRALSVLGSLEAPPAAVREDVELYRDLLDGVAASLLTLAGFPGDTLTSREHTLFTSVLDHAWRSGVNLDLTRLLAGLQDPPFERIGALPVDTFFPPKERFELVMRLNSLIASPRFQPWLAGHPLDIQALLYDDAGKPRTSVISIAHLDERERAFVVATLLGALIAWMRRQPGTTALRALFYMDEVFGFMPPVENPPAKRMLLTLLKQARAYGLGVVLATQNPVDLDYKGLSNAGSWFLGRLQTARDKQRVLDGLTGAAGGESIAGIDAALSGLGKRRFLLHNVHEQGPILFETRWVMSYLAGPLTRDQIRRLSGAEKPAAPGGAPASRDRPVDQAPRESLDTTRPVVSPEVQQVFLDSAQGARLATIAYRPRLMAKADVRYVRASLGLDERRSLLLATAGDERGPIDWSTAEELAPEVGLAATPVAGTLFMHCPASLLEAELMRSRERAFERWLRTDRPLLLYRSPALGAVSRPAESERDFRIRLQMLGKERRAAAIAKLEARYHAKLEGLRARSHRLDQAAQRESQQASGHKLDTVVAVAGALLGAFMSRKRLSATAVSKIGGAIKKAGKLGKESGDIERAEESAEAVKEEIARLEAELARDIEALEAAYDAQTEKLEEIAVRPRAADVEVTFFGIGWMPVAAPADRAARST